MIKFAARPKLAHTSLGIEWASSFLISQRQTEAIKTHSELHRMVKLTALAKFAEASSDIEVA